MPVRYNPSTYADLILKKFRTYITDEVLIIVVPVSSIYFFRFSSMNKLNNFNFNFILKLVVFYENSLLNIVNEYLKLCIVQYIR